MDDSDFEDEELDADFEAETEPDLRAVIRRDGELRVVDWSPGIALRGALNLLVEDRHAAGFGIADLWVLRDYEGDAQELIARFAAGGDVFHGEVLLLWAAHIGYRRVWLEDHVEDLEPLPQGPAETWCSSCGIHLIDSGSAFWNYVRARGAFPPQCVLCAGDLPQWTPRLRETEARPSLRGSTEATS